MRVRLATVEDAEGILRAHVASVRGLCAKDYSAEQIEAWVSPKTAEDYRSAMGRGEVIWVAVVGELIAGLLWMKEGEVKALYIHPDHARQGAGRMLLVEAEAEARRRGIGEIGLTSTLTSVGFYLANGFERGEMTMYRLPNGVDLECVRMTKRMGGAGI